jgi:hypothetical protein
VSCCKTKPPYSSVPAYGLSLWLSLEVSKQPAVGFLSCLLVFSWKAALGHALEAEVRVAQHMHF